MRDKATSFKIPITIISVVYNAWADLEKTILSIMALPYKVEFIIIDGGSTDGTVATIKKYEHSIDYWCSEKDRGIYDAMNKGWEKAAITNHILFLGAGDVILELPGDQKLSSNCIYFGDVVLGNQIVFKSKLDFRLKIGNTLHHQALLVPKKQHPQPPFNINFKIYADFDFNQRLLKQKASFKRIDNLKAFALPGGLSDQSKTREWYNIIKNNFGVHYALLGFLYDRLQLLKRRVL